MLDSPVGAVVAASALEPTVALLERLDLTVTALGSLPPSLYGGPGRWADLASASRGTVRVVEVPGPAVRRGPFDGGPAALDLYSRDLQRSLDLACTGHGPRVRIELGPLVMHQVRLQGPDGLPVVLIDASSRRPSRLDDQPQVLHSEVHSLVWVVPSIDEALPLFTAAGLVVAFDLPLTSAAVSEVMGLPRPDVPIRMAMLSDAVQRPMRLELFEFPSDTGDPFDPTPAAGTVWPVFEVADLPAALTLPWTERGEAVEVAGRAVSRCVAPGGVVVELWS